MDSCLMLAPKLDGRKVETVEGLRQGEALHPLQEAFLSRGLFSAGIARPVC